MINFESPYNDNEAIPPAGQTFTTGRLIPLANKIKNHAKKQWQELKGIHIPDAKEVFNSIGTIGVIGVAAIATIMMDEVPGRSAAAELPEPVATPEQPVPPAGQ